MPCEQAAPRLTPFPLPLPFHEKNGNQQPTIECSSRLAGRPTRRLRQPQRQPPLKPAAHVSCPCRQREFSTHHSIVAFRVPALRPVKVRDRDCGATIHFLVVDATLVPPSPLDPDPSRAGIDREHILPSVDLVVKLLPARWERTPKLQSIDIELLIGRFTWFGRFSLGPVRPYISLLPLLLDFQVYCCAVCVPLAPRRVPGTQGAPGGPDIRIPTHEDLNNSKGSDLAKTFVISKSPPHVQADIGDLTWTSEWAGRQRLAPRRSVGLTIDRALARQVAGGSGWGPFTLALSLHQYDAPNPSGRSADQRLPTAQIQRSA
ncbi:hypothetical protein VDGL01_12380 [Verticillium dahliae]